MADFFDNGESWLVVRTLMNSLADLLKVAETDEEIAAGAVTSIPVATLPETLLDSGDTVILIDGTTGTPWTLTLTAAAEASDTALTVTEVTFTSAIPAGSKIYWYGIDFLVKMYSLRHPA